MGAYLSEPITEKESGHGSGNGLSYGYSGMQGWRNNMEDAHLTVADLGGECAGISLFGVFDGHGGAEVARFCHEHVPQVVKKQLSVLSRGSGASSSGVGLVDAPALWGRALTHTFHAIDDMLRQPEYGKRILEMKRNAREGAGAEGEVPGQAQARLRHAITSEMASARQGGVLGVEQAARLAVQMSALRRLEVGAAAEPAGPAAAANNVGCTAVCVLMSARHIVCANAGDSRAVLCRQAKAVPLSHDHKPNNEGERRRIYNAGGTITEVNAGEGKFRRTIYRVNGNLNLSRSIGDLEYKKQVDFGPEQQMICATPDVITVARSPDDEFIVLACDGIWEVKSNRQTCEFLRSRLARGREATVVAEELLDACLTPDPKKTSGRGADNMTCIVVQLRDLAGIASPPRRGGCLFGCRGVGDEDDE